jgi:SRSO17 transposase
LQQLRWACASGLPRGVGVFDAGYGSAFSARVTTLGMPYVAGILSTTTVWAPGTAALPTNKRRSGRGRPATRLRRDRKHRPLSVKALALRQRASAWALRQPASAWQTITWREGTAAPLSSRFVRLRVRPAHRDEKLTAPRLGEWLLIEWPAGEKDRPNTGSRPCRKTSILPRSSIWPSKG